MNRLIMCVRSLWAMCGVAFALLAAGPAISANLDFSGTYAYVYFGSSADISVTRIDNLDASGVSGTIKLELWAFSSPYTGAAQTGYKMAQYQVGQLAGGFFYSNVDSGTIPFTRPPDGTWVFTLFLTEFTGAANNQGYTPRDWHNFSSLVTFGAAPGRLSFATSINFGNQLIGTASAIQDTVITNVGGAMVTISGITTTDIVNFQGTSTGCTVLAPGASCTHHTTFTPQSVGAHTAIYEITSNGTGSPQSFVATGSGTNGGSSGVVTLVEYHHASFDHYFITPVAAEIALLDARAPPFQEWSRTGFSFNAYVPSTAPAGAVASCRFFNSHFAPKSSHFYAPHGFGCEATLALFPDWTLEDDKLFSTMLPSGTGACPAGTIPVYRLYNNGAGGAPNHRFTTSLTVRQIMLNQGHTPEGNGIGVSMCVPP